MQPYQEASKEINRQAQSPIRTLKKAGSLIGGATIAGKIIPFLSKHIPGELMRKGISKIEPRLGKFIEGALNNGYDLDDARNFMSDKFIPKETETQSQQIQEQTQENPVVKQAKDFEANYPDIMKALMGYINQGQSPEAAAGILKLSTPFSRKIKKIEKDSGKDFIDFVLEMMGGNQSSQMQQPQQMQSQAQPGTPPPQQQQSGGLDPQLAQLMNGIRSSIQQIRGNP